MEKIWSFISYVVLSIFFYGILCPVMISQKNTIEVLFGIFIVVVWTVVIGFKIKNLIKENLNESKTKNFF